MPPRWSIRVVNAVVFCGVLCGGSLAAGAQAAIAQPGDAGLPGPARPGPTGAPPPSQNRPAAPLGRVRAVKPDSTLPDAKMRALPKPTAAERAERRKLDHDLKICIGC